MECLEWLRLKSWKAEVEILFSDLYPLKSSRSWVGSDWTNKYVDFLRLLGLAVMLQRWLLSVFVLNFSWEFRSQLRAIDKHMYMVSKPTPHDYYERFFLFWVIFIIYTWYSKCETRSTCLAGTIRAGGILVAKTGSDATKYSSSIASIYSYVKALVNAIITQG